MKKRMMKEWMAGARERLVRNGESGQTYKGRMGRSARRAALVAAALLSCAGMSAGRVSAEGTRDIVNGARENANALGVTGDDQIARWAFTALPNGSFMGVNTQQKVKFYAYEGEVVFFGSSAVKDKTRDIVLTCPDGKQENLNLDTSRGHIDTTKEEEAGPKGICLPDEKKTGKEQTYTKVDETGFEPFKYEVKQSGVYEVQFKADQEDNYTSGGKTDNVTGSKSKINEIRKYRSHVTAWDVTVTQSKLEDGETNYYAVNGRVWMDAISIQTSGKVYGNLYTVTRDGYIWKFSLNGMEPNTFSMYANARGGIGTGTNASAYHSVHSPVANNTSFDYYMALKDKYGRPDGLYILGPDNEVTDIDAPNHMFINYPDISIPDSIVPAKPAELGKVTGFTYDGHGEKEDQKKEEEIGDYIAGYVGVGGYFEVGTEGASSYRIIIDMSNMYATQYHGETGKNCTGDDSHNDEICLSTDTDDSFIYYDESKNQWYSIRTKVKDSKGEWDRHPVNNSIGVDGLMTEKNINDLVAFVELSKSPAGFSEGMLGKDFGEYKCLGRILLGNAAVDYDADRINWNGRDEYGRILPVGTYFGKTGRGTVYCEPKAGEVHFPLGDVEHAINGVAVWLETAPTWLLENTQSDLSKQVSLRSMLYYNNEDKSLLRDFKAEGVVYDSANKDKSKQGNNAWVWNLPKMVSNSASGENSSRLDLLDRKWVTEEADFENKGIDGAASYELAAGVDGSRSLTKNAAVAKSDGIDHGVADVWAHIVAPESYRVPLSMPIALYHYANQKMVTGFVYLDTPKAKDGIGNYSKLTDDRELPEADVKAEYGKDASGNPVVYETKTDTNGYYNIPINMDYFKEGDVKEVKITVTYEDPEIKKALGEGDGTARTAAVEDITTYKVTTALTDAEQRIVGKPNVSVQTVSLDTSLKKIYAEDVGYTNDPTEKPIRIVKIWQPATLKDNSMSARFTIKGVLKSSVTTDRENDPAFNDGSEAIIFKLDEIAVDEALGGVTVIDSLPEKTYTINEGKEKSALSKEVGTEPVPIVYKVEEKLEGKGTTTECEVGEYKPEETNELTYDNWTFTNQIVPSTLKETVWYDANNNGVFDEGERPIENARIQIAKLDEKTAIPGEDTDDDSRYAGSFQYAKYDTEEAVEPTLVSRGKDDVTYTGDKGEYEFDGKLIAGRYRVTVQLPNGALYNTATFTGDGTSALKDAAESSISAISGKSTGTTVNQYFDVGIGSDYELCVGYGFMGGLSIRKNVEIENAEGHDAIIDKIKEEPFTFEIQLAEKPVGTEIVDDTTEKPGENQMKQSEMVKKLAKELAEKLGVEQETLESGILDSGMKEQINEVLPVGSVVVTVETFDLDIASGAEQPADSDMSLVFTEIPGEAVQAGRWSAVFQLKSGQRITVPNVDANTEYWLWEYDNQNDGGDSEKNGSDTDMGTSDAPLTYMPKGYSLAKLVGSRKMRNGNIPSTSRTVLVSYTNIYEPMPVKGFGGDGTDARKADEEDKKFTTEERKKEDGTKEQVDIDKALEIQATVKIVDADGEESKERAFRSSDKFKLLLEPLDSTCPVFETPGLDVKATETEVSAKKASVKAKFTDGTIVRFTRAGTYEYRLREARPFYDDGVEAIAGISYATEEYKLVITVEDVYQQLQIKEIKWYAKNKDGAWSEKALSGPLNEALVFNNHFSTDRMSITIAGNKVLESSVKGVALANVGPFEFRLTPGGSRKREEEIITFDKSKLAYQPMPSGTEDEDGVRSKTVENVREEVTDNVSFGEITFTAEDAGEDLQHAMIYRYYVEEVKPTTGKEKGIIYDESKPEDKPVYVRVYKEVKEDENKNQMQTVVAEMCDERGYAAAAGEDFTFTNEYHAEATVSLGDGGLGLALKKTIDTINADGTSVGADAQRGFKDEDRFVFTVEPQGDAPAVTDTDPSTSVDGDINWIYKANAGEGEAKTSQEITITGKTITFTNIGEYTYILRELDPFRAEREGYTAENALTGISYDPTIYTIKVNVANKAVSGSAGVPQYSGELEAKITEIKKGEDTVYSSGVSPSSTDKVLEFTNKYSPYLDEETIVGRKLLESNDPSVTLGRLLESGAEFKFRLTPAGKASYEEEAAGKPSAGLNYMDDETQPMPMGTDSDKSVTVTVSKDEMEDGRISFPSIPFMLEDVDGTSSDKAVVYRYLVEELLPEKGEEDYIAGVAVKPDDDPTLEDNRRYVYFKVYIQRQDEVDHVVAVRCDSAGETMAQSTYDFIITNTYTVPKQTIVLGDYIDAVKELEKDAKQKIPDDTVFRFMLEAQNGAPEPYGSGETESAAADIDMKGADSQSDGSLKKKLDLSNLHLSFTQEGDEYQYVLRELNPFNGEDAPAVPGVTYDALRYRLSFKTENNFTENKLDVILTKIESSEDNGANWKSIWTGSAMGAGAGSGAPTKAESLTFTNIYGDSSAVVPVSGSKVLEGAQNLKQGDFAFCLQAAGIKEYDETTKKYGALETDGETLKAMPLPAGSAGVELEPVPSTGGSTVAGLQRAVTKNGENTFMDEKVWLSRGAVNFGNLVFDEKHAGEDVEHAKIYAYKIAEKQPSGDNVTETDDRLTEKGEDHDVTYADNEVTLYIRVYKIEVNQVEMIAAEFCDENGSTQGSVNRSFTFTNVYTPHPLEISPDELLREALNIADDSDVAQKTLTVNAGTFSAEDAEDHPFLFAFYPASYPIADAPMPKDGAGNEIPRAIVSVNASEFANANKETAKSELFSINENKIEFSSEGTCSYRIRELNPAVDTLDDSEKSGVGDLTAIENMEYDSVFYMLTVTVTYNNKAGKYEYTAELSRTDSLTGESGPIGTSGQPLPFKNIYTERHKLIYDGNAASRADGKTDNVYDFPESEIYECGAEITLAEQKPVYAEADGQNVAFIGWSETKINKVLTATDKGILNNTDPRYTAGQENVFSMGKRDITLYAVWGYDRDGSGTADVLEEKLTLTYDTNAQSDGTVELTDGYEGLIDPVLNLLPGDRVTLADCRPVVTPVSGGGPSVTYKLKHPDVDGVAVVFAGWTEEEDRTGKILDYDAHDTVKLLQDTITMPSGDKTVCAAWGYDRDGDGVADVLEETYKLNYVANPQKGGTVEPGTMPNDYMMAGHLTDTKVDLETYSNPGKTPPKHSGVDGKAVAFVGWTLEQTTELYTKDSPAAPVTVEHVTFGHDDIYVYASWGYDENNNGVADVLEKQYTLTYHGNAQENGTVSEMPEPERVTGNLAGNPLDLAGKLAGTEGTSGQKPTLTAISDGADVLFLGWTETQSGRIYDVSDPTEPTLGADGLEDQLLKPGEGAQVEFVSSEGEIEEEKKENPRLCAVWTEDADLYAAWAKDVNKDSIADYKQGLLVYNGNPVQGMAWQVPESEIHSLRDSAGNTVTAALADGVSVPDRDDPILLPIHSDVEDRKVAFVGWTDDADWYADAEMNKIYSRTEEKELPELITRVDMDKLVTVYAVWGYDENGSGVADVLEDLYTLRYEGNPQEVTENGAQKDGTVEEVPDAVQDLLKGETVQLADGETVKDAAGKVIPLPAHSSTEFSDGSGKTEEVPVLFVGWTDAPVSGILEGEDEIPDNIYTQVTVGTAPFEGTDEGDRKIITLYAAWGYDTNGYEIPDVLEECRLVYDENKIDEGNVDGMPNPEEHLIFGQPVPLPDGETVMDASGTVIPIPRHDASANPDPETSAEHPTVDVVFVGWTEQKNTDFYAAGDEMPHCLTEVTIRQKLTTVYAAWGYDVDGNGTPDVKESCRLVFDGNPQREGSVDGYPVEKEGLTYAEKVELDDILTKLGKTAPTHTDVMVGGVPTKAAFAGWTLEPVEELLTRSSAAPDCVSEVEMLHSVVTVYAAWGLDTNGNGVADVVEERYRLIYDGNTDGAGTAGNLPLTVTGLLQDDQVTLIENPTPLYPEPDQKEILFIGWTKEKTDIFDKDDTPPEFVKQVTVGSEDFPGTEIDGKKTVTVYAAWGRDENEDGIPDVWQNGRLVYDGNVPEGGSLAAGTLPEDDTGHTYNPATSVKLDFTKTPKLTGKVTVNGVETAAAFIGWTKEPQSMVYTRQNTRGEIEELQKLLLDEVSFDAKEVTVYAVWGADENGSGIADVLEGKYSLVYDGNPVIGEAFDVPEDENNYLVNERITLSTKTPTHSDVEGRTVVFLGWTLEPSPVIYEGAGKAAAAADGIAAHTIEAGADGPLPELIDTVDMEEGGMTVYAAWGYVTNQVNLPVTLTGKKTVKAEKEPFAMKGGEFGFKVIPAKGNLQNDPVDETRVTNDADGSIPLIDAVYRETGTYQYTMMELDDSEIPGMQYDDSLYEVTVTVTGSGREVQAEVAVTRNGRAAESILFENTYVPAAASVSIEGRKTLTGRNLESGEFTFVLEPVSAEVEEEAEGQNPVSAIAAEAGFGMEDSVQSETQTQTEAPARSEETQAQTEAPAQSEEAQMQTETHAQSETQTEASAQSEETQTQTETPAQSETQAQTEAPAQSETQAYTEVPAQSEETQAQTELVLTCSYVPHTHTEECLNEAGMLVCGYADYVVHTHNEDCYDSYGNLVCMLPELEEHQHDESCYEWKDELVCGLLEGDGHTHSDSCYTVDTTLICGLEETPGHTHSDSCYTVDTTLICGLEETAGHFHDEYCYDEDGNLICGWEESEGHSHTDSCYQKDYRLVCGLEETPGHVHSDSCYERTSYLSCGQEEMPAHHHDASCYLSVQQCDKPEITLHKHSKKCYERVYNEEEEKWESVLSCGKLEVVEHVHGPECFTAAEVQQPPENSVDIIADASEEELNLGASDGISEPEEDASGSVVTGGLQIVSVEVVPTEPSGQSMPEPAAESETTTEAVTEAGSGTEAVPEPAAESETATEAVTEAASGTEVTPEPAAESETATEAVTEAGSGTEVTPEPAAESETTTEAVTEAASGTEVTPEPAAESETATEAVTEAASGMEAVPEPAAESETTAETMAEEAAESETVGETVSGAGLQAGVQTLSLDEAMQQANKLTVTRALEAEDIPMPASPEAQNTAAGVFRFGAIEYTKPGVYTYRISEKNTKAEGIVFDDTVYYATVIVTEEQAGVLRSAAEIRTESGDVVPDAVFANTYLPPVPEIVKAQSVNDGPILEETQNVYEGDKITYYLTVTNSAAAGAAAAKDVVVSDAIPSGLEMVANSISDGGKLENRVITWELGNIPAGGSRTVSFSVTAPQVQTNIVRTNMANVRASNSPSGANVWSGSNVVRINVLALRPKSPDTPDTKDPEQTEQENRETEKNTESESESEKKESRENETEEEETDAVVPPASDERNTGEGQGSLGGSSAGGSDGNAAASAAKTGDETNAAFWLTLMLAAGAVLLLQSLRLLFCRPKRREM